MNTKKELRMYNTLLKSVDKTLTTVGDTLCKKGVTEKQIVKYDDLQQRLGDLTKTLKDLEVSENIPKFVLIRYAMELNHLHNDIKMFATRR